MIFLRNKRISRRTFLQGTGVCLSLPLLESMAFAGTARRPRRADQLRLGFYFVPHGAVQSQWRPATDRRARAEPDPEAAGAVPQSAQRRQRSRSAAGVHRRRLGGGQSLQLLRRVPERRPDAQEHEPARHHRRSGGRAAHRRRARCCRRWSSASKTAPTPAVKGWSCAYRDTISWLDERTPLPVERNPQVLFERLFGTGATDDARASNRVGVPQHPRRGQRADRAAQSGSAGRRSAPPRSVPHGRARDRTPHADRHVASPATCDRPPSRSASRDDFEEHLKTMFDLQVLAWQAGMTRVSTLMLAVEASNAVYPKSGVRDAFHPLSHHSNIQENKDKLAQINRYHIGLFGYLLEKMQQTPDGEGTLLDQFHFDVGQRHGRQQRPQPRSAADAARGRRRRPQGWASHQRAGGKKVPLANLHLTPAAEGWHRGRRRSATARGRWTSEMRLPSRRTLAHRLAIAGAAWSRSSSTSRECTEARRAPRLRQLAWSWSRPCVWGRRTKARVADRSRRRRRRDRHGRHLGTALGRASRRCGDGEAAGRHDAHQSISSIGYGLAPLHVAAREGRATLVQLLLDAGASPNLPGRNGETALLMAARKGCAECVQALHRQRREGQRAGRRRSI